jgi:hypothetical protein
MNKLHGLVLLSLISLAAPANAGWATFGHASEVRIKDGGQVLFNTSATHNSPPVKDTPANCTHIVLERRFAINTATDGGKAMLSTLLTAIARGKRVFISGANSCSIWPDTETAAEILVED